MAKQKAIVEETLPVEQVVVEQTPVVETGEAIVEELPVEEQPLIVIPEEVEQEEVVVEEQSAPRASNEVGVVNIVQKTPSGFRLLLETGEIIRVSKDQYTKGQSTIIL